MKHHLDEEDSGEIEEFMKLVSRGDNESLERAKKRLYKHQKLTEQEINSLFQLQKNIIELQVVINQREKQINQIIIKGGNNINHFQSTFYDSASGGTINDDQKKLMFSQIQIISKN